MALQHRYGHSVPFVVYMFYVHAGRCMTEEANIFGAPAADPNCSDEDGGAEDDGTVNNTEA